MLQWSGAAAAMASTGGQRGGGSAQPQPVEDLPGGWRTLPDLSWDAGGLGIRVATNTLQCSATCIEQTWSIVVIPSVTSDIHAVKSLCLCCKHGFQVGINRIPTTYL